MVCVFPMVHLWGLIGACASTLLGYSAGIAYMLHRLRREIDMSVDPRGPAAGLAVVIVAMIIFYLAPVVLNGVASVVILLGGGYSLTRLAPRRRS